MKCPECGAPQWKDHPSFKDGTVMPGCACWVKPTTKKKSMIGFFGIGVILFIAGLIAYTFWC